VKTMENLKVKIEGKIDALIDMLHAEELNEIEKAKIKGMITALENVLIMMN
jgi:hypothetical protein